MTTPPSDEPPSWEELVEFHAYDAECVQPLGSKVLFGLGNPNGASLATIVWCSEEPDPITRMHTVWIARGKIAQDPLPWLQHRLAGLVFIGWFTYAMKNVETAKIRQRKEPHASC